jgi:hypothetical protein
MLTFFTYLIVGWLFVFGIGYLTMKLFKLPKAIKKGITKTVDNTIDRAFERNPQQTTIVEEHHVYNDIKILNQK